MASIAYLNMICRESFIEWTKKQIVTIKRKKERKKNSAKFTKTAFYALRVFLFFYIKGTFLGQIKIHTFQRKDKSVIIPLRKSSIAELSPRKLLPWFQRKCVKQEGVTWCTAGNHKEVFYPALECKLITSYASRQIKNVNVNFCIINSFLFLKAEFYSSQQKQVELAFSFRNHISMNTFRVVLVFPAFTVRIFP